MQVYFIRHAQSQNNALFLNTGGRVGRVSDPALTEMGCKQTACLAEYLGNHTGQYGWTHIYTSLMQRAILTALPVAEALKMPLRAEMELHETGGVYMEDESTGEPIGLPGRTRVEYEKFFPALLLPDALDGNGWWNRPFEVQEDRYKRANRVVKWLIQTHPNPDDHVAIVSHYGFFNYFLWAMFGQTRPVNSLFTVYNTSLSLFEVDEEGIRAVYINRVDHLPDDLVTE
jgi:2,3-bisphosphoglycerate-dependent phosphoglycerate mutase